MRTRATLAASLLLLSGCGGSSDPVASKAQDQDRSPAAPDAAAPAAAPAAVTPRWDLQSSGEGDALVLLSPSGATAVRLFCAAGSDELLVNVPGFTPVASEERMSFGSGGEVVALVADTSGDPGRGGVSGTGAVPANLSALIGGPVAVNYGYQNSGPHPAPSADLARAFVAACAERAVPPRPKPAAVSACLMQGDERLAVRPLRAVGTEPFWGARIEGRCVTYSHPEDQQGTRVWTRYTPDADGGTWVGALDRERFELRTRADPRCSDGMSDRRYPIAVDLLVNGERRRGCAEPI